MININHASPLTLIFSYSLLATTLPYSNVQAESYTYWYSPNFLQPRFYSAEEGCNFLYSDNWWAHLKSQYMPSNNYYQTPNHLRCATKFTSSGAFNNYFGDIYRTTIECSNGTKIDMTTGKCQLISQKGHSDSARACENPTELLGNPINIATGNKFQEEIDFTTSSFTFSRYYNSLDGVWRHSLSSHLIFKENEITLIKADGSEHLFTSNGTSFISSSDFGNIIHENDHYKYTSQENEVSTFTIDGKLSAIAPTNKPRLDLSRQGNAVLVLMDGNQVAKLTEDLLYQPKNFSSDTSSITYSYNNNRLTSVITTTNGLSKTKTYQTASNNPNLITSITDENGVKFSTWTYDTLGRATSSEHAAGAEKITLSYKSDGSVVLTNEYGRKATYRFALFNGMKRITSIEGQPTPNCPSSNSTFTYDAGGLLKTRTDAKGNLTTYDYNDRGLETSRTEASGTPQARTTTTEWHPTLFLKTKVTEPDRITTYQYDAQGRKTGQIVTPR